jgi:hypothetical protein
MPLGAQRSKRDSGVIATRRRSGLLDSREAVTEATASHPKIRKTFGGELPAFVNRILASTRFRSSGLRSSRRSVMGGLRLRNNDLQFTRQSQLRGWDGAPIPTLASIPAPTNWSRSVATAGETPVGVPTLKVDGLMPGTAAVVPDLRSTRNHCHINDLRECPVPEPPSWPSPPHWIR